jgi:hypothetical protein
MNDDDRRVDVFGLDDFTAELYKRPVAPVTNQTQSDSCAPPTPPTIRVRPVRTKQRTRLNGTVEQKATRHTLPAQPKVYTSHDYADIMNDDSEIKPSLEQTSAEPGTPQLSFTDSVNPFAKFVAHHTHM